MPRSMLKCNAHFCNLEFMIIKFLSRYLFFIFIIGSLNAQVIIHDRASGQFIPNKGQWPKEVNAQLHTDNARIWILKDGLRFALRGPGENDTNNFYVFTERFEGSRQGEWISMEPTKSEFNYFISGTKEITQVSGFRKGRMENLYPGVSLIFELNDFGELKTTWISEEPDQLNLLGSRFEGVNGIQSKSNHLFIDLPVGQLTIDCPIAKTRKGKSKVHWRKTNSIWRPVSKKSILIDPVYRFSTFSGSISDNFGYTATYDKKGRTWAGGVVFGGQFPYFNGIQSSFAGGATDLALMLFSSDGTGLLSGTFFGGNNREQPHSMMVASNGDLYVLGVSGSNNLAVSVNAYDSSFNGGSSIYGGGQTFNSGTDMFILRLDSTGSIKKSMTYIGGSGNDGINEFGTLNYGDEARGEILTTSNGIYIASSTKSIDFPTTNGSSLGGVQDGILIKMSSGLDTLLWSSYYGGSNMDALFGLVELSNQNEDHLFAVGVSESDGLADSISFQPLRAGVEDAWIIRVDINNGTLEKSTYFGGLDSDYGFLVAHNKIGSFKAVGDSNSIVIVGNNKSNLTSVNSSWFQSSSSQYFLWTNSDLDSIYRIQTFGSGNLIDQNVSPTALMIDECGSLYFSGWGGATNTGGSTNGLFCTTDALQKNTDGSDFYFLVIGNDSNPVYASYFGDPNSSEHVDGGTSRFDPNGVIHQAICAGCGGNSNLPIFPHNAYSNTNGSTNCNMAAVQIAFEMQKVDFNLSLIVDTICSGSVAEISGQASRCDSTFISWGDGQTLSSVSPVGEKHVFSQPGFYNISIYGSDFLCGTDISTSLSIYVTVPEPPLAGMDIYFDSCDASSAIILIPSDSAKGHFFYVSWGDGVDAYYSNNDSIFHFYNEVYFPIELTIVALDTICNLSDSVSYSIQYREPLGDIDSKITVDPCTSIPMVIAKASATNSTKIFWYLNGFSSLPLTGTEVAWALPASGEYSIDIVTWDSICSNWDSTVVTYISFSPNGDSIIFPNVFTPNNDGYNDFLKLSSFGASSIADFAFEVYNRWGQRVYSTQDPGFLWDGRYKNKNLSSGVYFWLSKWTTICGSDGQSHGDVMINTH